MANTFGDTDLDAIKVDPFSSVPISYGSAPVQTGYGFDFVRGSNVQGFVGEYAAVIEETAVSVKYGDFTGLKQGQQITVDGTAYEIRRVSDVDDAHVVRITLADA